MQGGHLETQQRARLDEVVDTGCESESLVDVARCEPGKGGFTSDPGDHDPLTLVYAVDDGTPDDVPQEQEQWSRFNYNGTSGSIHRVHLSEEHLVAWLTKVGTDLLS